MARVLTTEQTAPPLGINSVRPVTLGGTNANNAQQAAVNLQYIGNFQVNQPGGCPSLGLDSKIPANYFPAVLLNQQNPIVTGPLTVGIGQTNTYTITNYNSSNVYSVNTASGSAVVSGNTITWTAPTIPGVSGFIINGVNVVIEVTYGNLSISGPSSINENTPAIFTVENYNSGIQYAVTPISGTVTITGSQITYTAPATDGVNTLFTGFMVNSTTVYVTVSPPPAPVITGPVTLAIGQVGTYTMTNYVATGTYDISTTGGTLTQSGNTLTYTAPQDTGTYSFTVNGVMSAVNVILPTIMAPSVTAPVEGAINLGPAVTFTATPFAMSVGQDTQQATNWQLATDALFLNIVQSSLADTVNLSSWTVQNLLSNAVYYARVQYIGTNNEISAYSTAVSFTTKASYIPTLVTGEIDGTTGLDFGYAVAMDSAGLTLVVGAPTGNLVSVYQFSNGAWVLFQTINAPTGAFKFGMGLSMNSLGNAFVVGAPDSQRIFIFQLQNNSWTQTASILSPTASGKFGYAVALNDSVNSVFIADYASALVYNYTYDGASWNLAQTLTFTGASNYGYSIAINPPGTLLAVGAYLSNQVLLYQNGGQGFNLTQTLNAPSGGSFFGVQVALSRQSFTLIVGAGTSQTVYIYTSATGAVWNLFQTLTSPDPSVTGYFGRCVATSAQGTVLMVGAYAAGKAYLYQLTSTQYSLAQTFTASQTPNLGFSAVLTDSGTKAVVFDDTAAIGLSIS